MSEIYSSVKKRRGKSKYLLSVEVKISNSENEEIDARIVYVRDRNNKKKWIAFISTDMKLDEEEIIELYGKRWDIEVFFKISKSYLNLGSEFQGLSYDSMTAHTAVVMTRYMILAVQKRREEDPRALGELFFSNYDELPDKKFHMVINLIFEILRKTLTDILFLTKGEIEIIITKFFDNLPEHLKFETTKKCAS